MKKLLLLIFLTFSTIVSARTYYVSVGGNDANSGNLNQPFGTWQKGFDIAQAGDTVFIRGGTYYTAGIKDNNNFYCGVVQHFRSGTLSNPIVIMAYPGEVPILDCSKMTQSGPHLGIYFEKCNYWYLKGLTIRRADQLPGFGAAGIQFYSCNGNTLENITSHNNGGSGIRIIYDSENNLLLNCDTYSNYDPYSLPLGEHADGIEISDIRERNGNERVNTMRGCRSWDNSDDGYDHMRCEGILVFEQCWAWHNGYIPGTETRAGNGVGFKLGTAVGTPETIIQRVIAQCISYNNRTTGFSQEDANVKMSFYNNIAYRNDVQGYIFTTNNVADILRNNITYKNGSTDILRSNQIIDHNSWQNGLIVSDADFLSLDGSQLTRPRKTGGGLPDITFVHLAPGSDLIDAGVNVGLPFSGQAPDLGAFETSLSPPPATVVANQAPVVNISSPLKNASFTSPATITIDAAASDPDGTITKVEFFQNNLKLGEKVTAPYSLAWNLVPEGAYSLTAVATDNKGGKTVSAAVSITVIKAAATVNQMPVVSISSPIKGGSFTAPATITIDAAASDPDGSITKVEFFQNNLKLAERVTAPYSLAWTLVPEGTYSLTAVATDNKGGTTVSAAVSITVIKPVPAANQLPVISILSPNKGSSFSSPASMTIDINASDPDGLITKVELFNGSEKLDEKTEAPYSFNLKNLMAGSYVLKAVATDNMNGSSTSASLDFTVSSYIDAREYFNLYPNPNDGKFSIAFTTLMEAEIFTLTVVDLIGKIVYREELTKDDSTRLFDLSHLNSGIYVLMISANQILLTQKFIKG